MSDGGSGGMGAMEATIDAAWLERDSIGGRRGRGRDAVVRRSRADSGAPNRGKIDGQWVVTSGFKKACCWRFD